MDLSTRYLGLDLESPLMLGASPLVRDLDAVRRAEDAGASAVVMCSLFQEQVSERAGFYPPDGNEFYFGPVEYLEQIRRLKSALRIPVIGSLNGSPNQDWIQYTGQIDRAGADALELNLYRVSTDFDRDAASIEDEAVDMVRMVVTSTSIPVAVKLSPFYTSLPHFSRRLVDAGAKGFVLFNRVYQPDVDLENLEVERRLDLSSSSELLLRLRWLAILSGELRASLAATGGVHSSRDALKAIVAGADAVQLVSEIIQHGFVRFTKIRREMCDWLETQGHQSVAQVRASMNRAHSLDPSAQERAAYLRALHAYPRDPRA